MQAWVPKVQVQEGGVIITVRFVVDLHPACVECIFEARKGVCIHHSLEQSGGHYVCYFLHHVQNQWFYANDEQVRYTLPL